MTVSIISSTELLSRFWSSKFPTDVQDISLRLGLSIRYGLSKDDYVCKFSRNEGRCEIFIDMNESSVRQRFALAHCLGHYCLGHYVDYQDRACDSAMFCQECSDPEERVANIFASEILIPQKGLYFMLDNGHGKTLTDFSQIFGTSHACTEFRLKTLGLI